MRNRIGNALMVLGMVLMLASLTLLLHNRREATGAERASQSLLPDVVAQIEQRSEILAEGVAAATPAPDAEEDDGSLSASPEPEAPEPTVYVNPYDSEMTVVYVDGNDYIGYLSIPELNLELPVMNEWSYPKLRKTPCRYTGSTRTDDLVIMAHNYARHFGYITRLSTGDEVIFTDMNGVVIRYEVVETEELSPRAVKAMTDSRYDLTLFTCTYGGRTRIAVRCERR